MLEIFLGRQRLRQPQVIHRLGVIVREIAHQVHGLAPTSTVAQVPDDAVIVKPGRRSGILRSFHGVNRLQCSREITGSHLFPGDVRRRAGLLELLNFRDKSPGLAQQVSHLRDWRGALGGRASHRDAQE